MTDPNVDPPREQHPPRVERFCVQYRHANHGGGGWYQSSVFRSRADAEWSRGEWRKMGFEAEVVCLVELRPGERITDEAEVDVAFRRITYTATAGGGEGTGELADSNPPAVPPTTDAALEQAGGEQFEQAIKRYRTAAVRVSESTLQTVDARRRIEADAFTALLDRFEKQKEQLKESERCPICGGAGAVESFETDSSGYPQKHYECACGGSGSVADAFGYFERRTRELTAEADGVRDHIALLMGDKQTDARPSLEDSIRRLENCWHRAAREVAELKASQQQSRQEVA